MKEEILKRIKLRASNMFIDGYTPMPKWWLERIGEIISEVKLEIRQKVLNEIGLEIGKYEELFDRLDEKVFNEKEDESTRQRKNIKR